ncbi:UDP-glycosyltransferase 74E2-like [Panicum miliaceum]|uniref:UDP-glycosyltransferase 74E2-like n=1 Tax=Panicum miliaceum TaxID=4540 RepID=A0A3L6TV43_PANMI|nr:UDP-glycosyltransferase 74E2-like [Panicum miliaceum]
MVRKLELERCVREVMEGETSKQFRSNAQSWSEKAKKAMAERGSSDSNMVEFLSKLRTNRFAYKHVV